MSLGTLKSHTLELGQALVPRDDSHVLKIGWMDPLTIGASAGKPLSLEAGSFQVCVVDESGDMACDAPDTR